MSLNPTPPPPQRGSGREGDTVRVFSVCPSSFGLLPTCSCPPMPPPPSGPPEVGLHGLPLQLPGPQLELAPSMGPERGEELITPDVKGHLDWPRPQS